MGKCWALKADGSVCGADNLDYCDPKEWPPQRKYCTDHCPEGGLSRTNTKRDWQLLGPNEAKCEHLSRAWAATIAKAPRKKRVPLPQDAAVAAGSMPAQPSSQLSSQPSSSQHATTTLDTRRDQRRGAGCGAAAAAAAAATTHSPHTTLSQDPPHPPQTPPDPLGPPLGHPQC